MPKRSLSLERSRQLQAQPAGSKSWISFTGSEERALVNGDIAALEPELNETLKRLLDGGIHIASIHTSDPRDSADPLLPFLGNRTRGGTCRDVSTGA